MEIKTKFQLYERVYPIEFDKRLNKWVVIPYFLDDNLCTINSFIVNQSNIYCSLEINIFDEKDCFATEEQAQEECDKRNYKAEYEQWLDKAIEKVLNKGE